MRGQTWANVGRCGGGEMWRDDGEQHRDDGVADETSEELGALRDAHAALVLKERVGGALRADVDRVGGDEGEEERNVDDHEGDRVGGREFGTHDEPRDRREDDGSEVRRVEVLAPAEHLEHVPAKAWARAVGHGRARKGTERRGRVWKCRKGTEGFGEAWSILSVHRWKHMRNCSHTLGRLYGGSGHSSTSLWRLAHEATACTSASEDSYFASLPSCLSCAAKRCDLGPISASRAPKRSCEPSHSHHWSTVHGRSVESRFPRWSASRRWYSRFHSPARSSSITWEAERRGDLGEMRRGEGSCGELWQQAWG